MEPIFLLLAIVVILELWPGAKRDDRTRHIRWLWPSVALAMAVQMIWTSSAEDRLAMVLLGAVLVIAAAVLAAVRRRRR